MPLVLVCSAGRQKVPGSMPTVGTFFFIFNCVLDQHIMQHLGARGTFFPNFFFILALSVVDRGAGILLHIHTSLYLWPLRASQGLNSG